MESSALSLHRRVKSVEVGPIGDRALHCAGIGPKRHGELKRLIPGVSDKVLIQQLKDLEADQVLTRTDYKEVPPRVDYALTSLGRSLAEAIVPLCTWGTENAAQMASIFAKRDALS
ncbi:winged helix-turn-helix transcriptional regulator [Pseudomonas gingeri]|uniref:winged helix-turn-helix transcriptional regulator n=1 Tax=Pseudomonas gingeri TaxID=117681 RepID=UPI003F74E544